jgi:hypothetical protein
VSNQRFLLIACLFTGLLAFALRAHFNLEISEHRFCDSGDPYFFHVTATGLLKLLQEPQWWMRLPELLGTPSPNQMNALLSEKLADRLLLDGPAYPAYLALLQGLVHIDLSQPKQQYLQFAQSFALFNSVIDALISPLAVLIAFSVFRRRVTALIAGLFWAIYTPAIVATPLCYSEPFATFVLALWFYLALNFSAKLKSSKKNMIASIAIALAFGVVTGVVMLTRPSFAALPFISLGLFAIFNWQKVITYVQPKVYPLYAAYTAGAVAMIVPWLYVTKLLTGKMALAISRVPGYNLSMGNQLWSDGWVAYSPHIVPFETGPAIQALLADVAAHPLAFASLYLRKILRLWLAPWNDMHHTYLLGNPLMNAEHSWFLLLAMIAVVVIFSQSGRNSEIGKRPRFQAFTLLTLIVVFHFTYLPFVAIARYAATAAFAVIILAAAGATINSSPPINKLRIQVLFGAFFLTLAELCGHTQWYNNLLADLSENVAVFLTVKAAWPLSICFLAVLGVWGILKSRPGKLASITALLLGGTICGALLADLFSLRTLEFSRVLKPGDSILLRVPCEFFANSEVKDQYLLVDSQAVGAGPQSGSLEPALVVNAVGPDGKECKDLDPHLQQNLLPWWHLDKHAVTFNNALDFQANFEGKPKQAFRQWWVYPLAPLLQAKDLGGSGSDATKIGASQTLNLHLKAQDNVRVFGSVKFGQAEFLPSLKDNSWTKGFASFDCTDCRLTQTPAVLAKYKVVLDKPMADKQWRVFAMKRGHSGSASVLQKALAKDKDETGAKKDNKNWFEVYFGQPLWSAGALEISGKRPATATIDIGPISNRKDQTRFENLKFVATIKGNKKKQLAAFNVTLTGVDTGANQIGLGGGGASAGERSIRSTRSMQSWQTAWVPKQIVIGPDETTIYVDEILPESVSKWTERKLILSAVPFTVDQLHLRKKRCIDSDLLMTNAELTIFPSDLGPQGVDLDGEGMVLWGPKEGGGELKFLPGR